MSDFEENTLFDNMSFSDLMKDIYVTTKKKEQQIDALVKDLTTLVNNLSDATIVVPLIKEYLDVGVRNDEHLIKLAAVVQRMTSAMSRNSSGDGMLLSEEEKLQLLSTVEIEAKQLKKEVSAPLETDKLPFNKEKVALKRIDK